MTGTINLQSGKYIGYFTSLESSVILFADTIKELKDEWCFGMAIFETEGLNAVKLKEAFPQPPERGEILTYLKENYNCVHREGSLIGEKFPTRNVLVEKNKQ